MLESQFQDQPAVHWEIQCFPIVLSCQLAPKIWEQKKVNMCRLICFRGYFKMPSFFSCKHHWTYMEDLVKWALIIRSWEGCYRAWTEISVNLEDQTPACSHADTSHRWLTSLRGGGRCDQKHHESILHLKVSYFESILALQSLSRTAVCLQTCTYECPEDWHCLYFQ